MYYALIAIVCIAVFSLSLIWIKSNKTNSILQDVNETDSEIQSNSSNAKQKENQLKNTQKQLSKNIPIKYKTVQQYIPIDFPINMDNTDNKNNIYILENQTGMAAYIYQSIDKSKSNIFSFRFINDLIKHINQHKTIPTIIVTSNISGGDRLWDIMNQRKQFEKIPFIMIGYSNNRKPNITYIEPDKISNFLSKTISMVCGD